MIDALRDMRTDAAALMGKLSSKLHVPSRDCDSIKKYLDKLLKSFESSKIIIQKLLFMSFLLETLSSKSSTSIGDLKESFEKYSGKIRDCVSELSDCAPEDQVKVSESVEKFLADFMETFDLDERVSREDDEFIETLRRYPENSIAAHYRTLWDTLNGLESSDLPLAELSTFIDSAVMNFSRQFVDSNTREFAADMADEDIGPCMFEGIRSTFNKAMDKINEALPITGRESDDEGKQEEA